MEALVLVLLLWCEPCSCWVSWSCFCCSPDTISILGSIASACTLENADRCASCWSSNDGEVWPWVMSLVVTVGAGAGGATDVDDGSRVSSSSSVEAAITTGGGCCNRRRRRWTSSWRPSSSSAVAAGLSILPPSSLSAEYSFILWRFILLSMLWLLQICRNTIATILLEPDVYWLLMNGIIRVRTWFFLDNGLFTADLSVL